LTTNGCPLDGVDSDYRDAPACLAAQLTRAPARIRLKATGWGHTVPS